MGFPRSIPDFARPVQVSDPSVMQITTGSDLFQTESIRFIRTWPRSRPLALAQHASRIPCAVKLALVGTCFQIKDLVCVTIEKLLQAAAQDAFSRSVHDH